jgi:tetratricopeptide (TPR) repeat protein
LTADFEPTAFVKAGRKGEVVEDAYLAARQEYRRHRAQLYRANGLVHAESARPLEASRYLRRAVELDPAGPARPDLGSVLVSLGRGREALDVLLSGELPASPERILTIAASAADAAGVPSLQAELDRVRTAATKVEPALVFRDGPLPLTGKERLSTGGRLSLDAELTTVFYLAEAACRTCSADLEALRRVVPERVPIVIAPEDPARDEVVRRAMRVYRYDWPLVMGPGLGRTLDLPVPGALVVGRRGFSAVLARPPLAETLAAALAILARADVREDLPRASWSRGARAERKPPASAPGLLPEGLAPGEDTPEPEVFSAAVVAYREGRYRDALRAFEEIEARGDGWLLPPEARLNRALCLAGLGRREQARRLLLKTGDSRFQEAVDRTLEKVAAGPAEAGR